jgi:hypothetical protein
LGPRNGRFAGRAEGRDELPGRGEFPEREGELGANGRLPLAGLGERGLNGFCSDGDSVFDLNLFGSVLFDLNPVDPNLLGSDFFDSNLADPNFLGSELFDSNLADPDLSAGGLLSENGGLSDRDLKDLKVDFAEWAGFGVLDL